MKPNVTLWDWALAAHAAPGAEALLHALQDDHGQCVDFLLWAAWTGACGRQVSNEAFASAADLAGRWEQQVTAPLRSVRRVLKPAWAGMDDGARLGLREAVKISELDAERHLLDALEALAPDGGVRAPLAGRLQAALQAWPAPAPDEALMRLADIFERLELC